VQHSSDHQISAKKKVLFIVNPHSGTRSKKGIYQLIQQNVSAQYFDYEIVFTKAKGHATELASQAAGEQLDYVIAVGGDGTMNEVARSLLYTSTTLGIIPVGSGNGLARHLNIPMAAMSAVRLLQEGKRIKIDSCTLNDMPFFCTAGTGFDAYIGKCFAVQKKRGFQTYVQTTLREFSNYQPELYKLEINNKVIEKKAFLVSFANASQYGNNAYIAPKASVTDGLLDICLLRPFSPVQALNLGVKLFNKTLHTSRYIEIWQAEGTVLETFAPTPVHIDGEPCETANVLTVKVKPLSLQVLVP
jgi:diacylglycerol kinase (ATP)